MIKYYQETIKQNKSFQDYIIETLILYTKRVWDYDSVIKVNKIKSDVIIGYIDLAKREEYILNLDFNTHSKLLIKNALHELCHIKQIVKDEIYVMDDMIYWHDQEVVTFSQYDELCKKKNVNKYIQLPWEVQANDTFALLDDFLNSDEFNTMKEQNPQLSFIWELLM